MGNERTTRAHGVNTTRHYIHVVAVVVFGISLGALLILQAYPHLMQPTSIQEVNYDANVVSTSTIYAEPVTLHIPRINLRVDFEEPLGVHEDNTVEVPTRYDTVGWFRYGARGGEVGPMVILGHVDSYQGPAVFYSIGQLAQGDKINISQSDGSVVTYAVTHLERYAQDVFPTELVYGAIPYAGIRLVTCTGTFDDGVQRYSHNLVVYGTLISTGND